MDEFLFDEPELPDLADDSGDDEETNEGEELRCDAVGEGRFSAVALEMDPAARTFITLPVVPLEERTSQE